MGLFSKYKHIESQVTAIQMSNTNLKAVLDQLRPELLRCAVAEMCIGKDADANYQIVFRYNTDTQNSVLSATDYLVKLNDGKLTVVSEKDFDIRYINTTADAPVRPQEPQTPLSALVVLASKYFPDANITKPEDLTPAALRRIGEGLRAWYNEPLDEFVFKFNDCGITDPTGIAEIINAFASASFIKESTKLTLDFANGAWQLGDPNTTYNSFNAIALELLLGELRGVSGAYLSCIQRVYFHSVGHEAPSAVAPSVGVTKWASFTNKLWNITGITHPDNIKK